MAIDINHSSASEIGKAIASREVSAKEAVEASIERINEVNPSINAVVQDCFDRALGEADVLDSEISQGKNRGPLHGVPMTLKDSLDTEGVVTTWATLGRKKYVPDSDATLVSRLRQAGAILLGKTNTPELTLAPETDNLIYGRTSNPYDLKLLLEEVAEVQRLSLQAVDLHLILGVILVEVYVYPHTVAA